MVIDSTQRRTRRAIIGAGLGAVLATAATAIGRATPVRATDGDAVTVGDSTLTATHTTKITNPSNANVVFSGESTSGVGLRGKSGSSNGVLGVSDTGNAVYGTSAAETLAAIQGQSTGDSTGVLGWSGTGAPPTTKANTGVYGYAAQGGLGVGVRGEGAIFGVIGSGLGSGGVGVHGGSGGGNGVEGGSNTGNGVEGTSQSGKGVSAVSQSGFALNTVGRVRFEDVSGVASIPAGQTTAQLVVSHGAVAPSSFVLLTPRSNIGSRALWFTTNPTNGSLTIHISSQRSSTTKVAWLLLG
jgi:hypothetical protein